jgi:hypothetical protein
MKRREVVFLGIGLVVGLLVGLALMGNDDVRGSLFGTAGLTTSAPPAYFLVDMSESRDWLTNTYTDQAERISTAFNNVAPLITTSDFGEVVRGAEEDIHLIVDSAYAALTGLVPQSAMPAPTPVPPPNSLLDSLSDGNVSTCLGLDENPYNVDGYALYLYIEVPSTQTQVIPETWERLSEPKEDDLFWQRLACQSLGQAQQSGRR